MPPRASARLIAKAQAAVALDSQQTPPYKADHEVTAPTPSSAQRNDAKRPRKRQKTTAIDTQAKPAAKRAKENNRGKRKQQTILTELPLDVLLEIFEILLPLDLLNLSYTSKELRSILLADYASSLWTKAYGNLRRTTNRIPPRCPSDVNIRHYTSVVFGNHCLFCAGPKATIMHGAALTRLCNTCAPKHLIRKAAAVIDPDISQVCWDFPLKSRVLKYATYILKQDYERHARALQQCASEQAKELYKAPRIAKKRQNVRFHRMLDAWVRGQIQQKKDDVADIRAKRCEAIRQKLREEGFTRLGRWNWRIHKLPGANTATPLTDEGWERIKPKIIGVIEWQRQEDRQKDMISIFKNRMEYLDILVKTSLRGQPKPWIHAPLTFIANSEPFPNIMQNIVQEDNETWMRTDLSDEMRTKLSKLEDHISEISQTWRAEADEYLLGLLSEAGKSTTHAEGKEIDTTPLELATTFFKCHWCTDPISYPRILMHKCLTAKRKLKNSDTDDESEQEDASDQEPLEEVYGIPTVTPGYVYNKMSSWWGPTWNEAREFISVDEESTKSAKAIIQACKEDPEIMTATAMKDRNVRLKCMRCVPKDDKWHVMSWNMAILHDILVHIDEISAQGWSLVERELDLVKVKNLEAKILRKDTLPSYERCRHCEAVVRTGSNDAEAHLRDKHLVFGPTNIQDHVYVLLDAPMKAFPCAVKMAPVRL